MHQAQAKRYLPLPDYDLSKPNTVKLTIYGSVIDPAYSKLLIKHSDLDLQEIMALDRVQKNQPITKSMANELKLRHLIEGRRPNYYVSSEVAKVTGDKTTYIKNRKQDDDFYIKLVLDYIDTYDSASRSDIDKLLLDKISDILNHGQKITKIGHLLTKMRKQLLIQNIGSGKNSCWVRVKK